MAGLVKLANGSGTTTFEPIVSRTYCFVYLGRYAVSLELVAELSAVRYVFYMGNAVALLQQVMRLINMIIQRNFIALRYELLVPYGDELMVKVCRQKRHRGRKG